MEQRTKISSTLSSFMHSASPSSFNLFLFIFSFLLFLLDSFHHAQMEQQQKHTQNSRKHYSSCSGCVCSSFLRCWTWTTFLPEFYSFWCCSFISNCTFVQFTNIKLTETKLHAEYAAPIIAAEFPNNFCWEFVDTKYVKTTMNVRTISTPNRSHDETADVCEIAAWRFPWYPGSETL